MKKLLSITTVISIMTIAACGSCFAGTLDADSVNTVPVYLTTPGIEIDFTISEKITMTATAGTAEATVTDLEITNNSTMGQIEVQKLQATAKSGWTIVSDTSDFANMAADSKKISLVSDGHDFSSGIKTFADDEKLVNATKTVNIDFTGKTCATKTATASGHVADVVATIAIN
ncbi:MAG: hypothetical protein IJP00_00250 [Firmicutes bacterium]|nr:hypothetical protein [Bacillota bacterium]